VAVSDEQKGVLYYKAAQYANALPHLAAAWRERPGPVLAQMAAIAAACSGQDLEKLEKGAIAAAARNDLDRAGGSLIERFGISSLYLDNLRYIDREIEDFSDDRIARIVSDPSASDDTCVMPAPNPEGEWSVKLGTLFLEPGWYRVTVSARMDEAASEGAALTVSFVDVTGEIVHASATRPVDGLVGPDYRDVECWLQVADRLGPVTLKIATAPDVPLRLDRLTIKPDLVRQIESRDRLARAILDGTLAELRAEAQHRDALLACGDEAARSGEAVLALAAYEKAAEADPDSYRPYARLRGILDELPAELKAAAAAKLDEADALHALPARRNIRVRFKNGLVLTGYRLGAGEYAPGETLLLTLYWRVRPEDARRYLDHALFIQFIPEGGKKDESAFQGDTDLASSLRFNERLDRLRPIFRHPIRIPDDVPPGKYEIEIGLEIRPHRKRIRVLEADVPHTNNSATLGTVEIVPREESAPD
jgi:tetratricopeptide (TPR) repeat protein